MSNKPSSPRITITLGRSGQVVKRDVSHADMLPPIAGRKRSLRDRIGNGADSGELHRRQLNKKAHLGGSSTFCASSNVLHDTHIRKDDLRYKLMQKSAAKRAENSTGTVVDLREKLSKGGPPSTSSSYTRHDNLPEPRGTVLLGPTPPARSAEDLPCVDYTRGSNSPWTIERVKRQSPDEVLGASRNLSSQRSMDELQRKPQTRTVENIRPMQYTNSEILDSSRTGSSTPYLSRSVIPTGSAPKPVAQPMSQRPLSIAAAQRSSYMVDEQKTVDGLLDSLGLGKYAILFKAEEIDMAALKQMGENDLKELGIPMGPRKKLLLALLPRSKQQQ